MISQTPMQQWIEQHMSIFEELGNAVTAVAKSAGDAGRAIDSRGARRPASPSFKHPEQQPSC